MGNSQKPNTNMIDMRKRYHLQQGAGDNMWFITRTSDGEKRLMYWSMKKRREYVTLPLVKVEGDLYRYTDGVRTFMIAPQIRLYNSISDEEYTSKISNKNILVA